MPSRTGCPPEARKVPLPAQVQAWRHRVNRCHRRSPQVPGSTDLPGGFAKPQALNDLPYFEHLEPPVCHRAPPGKSRKVTRSESPRPLQPHSTGLIWPQIRWPHLAATRMALCARKFTPPMPAASFPRFRPHPNDGWGARARYAYRFSAGLVKGRLSGASCASFDPDQGPRVPAFRTLGPGRGAAAS